MAPCGKLIPARLDQRLRIERARPADVPIDPHPVVAAEADLRGVGLAGVHQHRAARSHHAGARSTDAGARMLEHRGGRQYMRGRFDVGPMGRVDLIGVVRQRAASGQNGRGGKQSPKRQRTFHGLPP